MSEEIHGFLEDLAGEGHYESRREFSVNIIAAQQKMGRYSLPRKSAWILKFVQAGAESGSETIEVGLGRDAVSVRFSPNSFQPLLKLRERFEVLRPMGLGEDHLFGGILALHSLGGKVRVYEGEMMWEPLCAEPVTESDSTDGLRIVYRPEVRGFWSRIRHRLWFQQALMEELKSSCYPAPTRIVADGRRLGSEEKEMPLLTGLISGREGAHLDYWGQIADENSIFCGWGSSRPEFIGFAVQVRLKPKGQESILSLEWVRSGVVVKRDQYQLFGRHRLMVRVLIPTRGLEFDASGFAIRESNEADERRRLGSKFLKEGLLALKGELSKTGRWRRFVNKWGWEGRLPDPHQIVESIDPFVDVCDSF